MIRRDPFSGQLDLEIPEPPAPGVGSLDYAIELRHTLSEMISSAQHRGVIRSRFDLAARMSELAGHEISKAMIDSWTADSKEAWRFPFEYAAAIEAGCASTRLQELLAKKRGSRILVGADSLLAELGTIQKNREELAERERAIKQYMKAHK
jgi:hypothetical protein